MVKPKIQSRKVLVTFIISFLIILIIPIAIGSIAYFEAGRVIEKESSSSKIAMLRQACTTIDSRLLEIQRISSQVANSYWVDRFLTVESPLDVESRFQVSNIIKELQPYRSNSNFVREFYIYYMKSDMIITSNSLYNPELFYQYQYSYKDTPYEKWHEEMRKQNYYYQKISVVDMLVDSHPRSMVTCTQSIPPADVENPSAQLVFLIDESNFSDMLKGISGGGFAYILDRDNKLLARSGDSRFSLPDFNDFKESEGFLRTKIDGSDMVISYIISQDTKWKYVSVVPRSVFMEKADHIEKITLWIVGVCFLVGLSAIYFLAYKNYTPIKRMVETLSSWSGDSPARGTNELDFIRDSVINTFEKNKQLEQTVKEIVGQNENIKNMVNKNRLIVRDSFIISLLKGRVDDFEAVKNWLSFYDVKFPYENFAVAILHVDDCTRFALNGSNEEWNLVRCIIISVAEEVANEFCRGYAVTLEYDTIALVLNFDDTIRPQFAKEKILNISKELMSFINEHFKTVITMGIGGMYRGNEGINTSFVEAEKAMDYKIIKGHSAVICFDEIQDSDKDYYYPITEELQLINYVKVGDYESCEVLLGHIYEENFIKRTLPLKLVQCLFFDIMSTAIKVLDAIKINLADIFGDNFNPVERLTSCETVGDIHQNTAQIYEKICAYINGKQKNRHNTELKEVIIQYLQEHYMEETLSQSVIADQLGISYSYLSKFFNREIGESMVDYINKLRIEKAKMLLTDPSLSLNDIADKVGYTSSKTLIRIFKQCEGITPGKFREYKILE